MKALAALLLLVILTGCVTPAPPYRPSVSAPAHVRVRSGDRVLSVPLEEYVLGSTLSEVSPVGDDASVVGRVFELQAVVVRTYAVAHRGRHQQAGFDLCDTTHCQVYEPARIGTSRFADQARHAVQRTSGQVLMFSGRPAEALYHSDCGGHTAAADGVWGGTPVAYLTGSKDNVPALTHRRWQFDVSMAKLREALNLDARSHVGGRLDRVAIANRDDSGRASVVDLGGERPRTIRGEDFRAILNETFGTRAILSTRFSVTRKGQNLQFAGTGFGHGVGLCQVGAAARVRAGEPVGLILAAYFPGTQLGAIRPVPPPTTAKLMGPNRPLLLNSP